MGKQRTIIIHQLSSYGSVCEYGIETASLPLKCSFLISGSPLRLRSRSFSLSLPRSRSRCLSRDVDRRRSRSLLRLRSRDLQNKVFKKISNFSWKLSNHVNCSYSFVFFTSIDYVCLLIGFGFFAVCYSDPVQSTGFVNYHPN